MSFKLWQDPRVPLQFQVETSLLRDDGGVGNPFQMKQGNQRSSQVEEGNRHSSRVARALLGLWRETQRSSPALTGISGFRCRLHWGVRRRLILGHGPPLPYRGGKGVSGLLWS